MTAGWVVTLRMALARSGLDRLIIHGLGRVAAAYEAEDRSYRPLRDGQARVIDGSTAAAYR